MKRFIPLFFIVILISGCATTNPRTNFYMGKVEASTITDGINYNFWLSTVKVNEEKRGFSLTDDKVYWAGSLWNDYTFNGLSAYWFSPQGDLFKTTKCLKSLYRIYYAQLPIKEIPANLQGQWSVTIKDSHGEFIDSQKFYIGKSSDLTVKDAIAKWTDAKYDISKAEAVVILDERSIEVMDEFMTKETLHRKIKILTEQGKRWSEVYIPFFAGCENIDLKFAHAISPSGKVVNVKEGGVITVSEEYPSYSARKVFVMNMPAVEVGSIIEYELTLKSIKPKAEGMFDYEYNLAWFAPCIESSLTITSPQKMELFIKNFNIDITPEIKLLEGQNKKIYSWNKKNIRPYEEEISMPSYREVSASIVISTVKDWKDIASWWRNLIKDKYEASAEIKSLVSDLTKGMVLKKQKIKALYSYVKEKIRYVGFDFGTTIYSPASAKEVFNNKYGDCKDQVMLLMAMLKEAGINSYSTLVRSTKFGPLQKDIPSMKEFDHAIVAVELDKEMIFLDPTAKHFSFGVLPYTVEGSEVLVVKDDDIKFDKVPRGINKNVIATNVELKVKKDLNIDGEVKVVWEGQDNGLVRTVISLTKDKQKENFVNEVLKGIYPYAALASFEFLNEEDCEKDLKLNVKFKLNQWINQAGDIYILKLFSDESSKIPDYLTKQRTNPIVENYLRLTKAIIQVELPANLKVKTLPGNFSISTPYVESYIKFSGQDSRIKQEQAIASKKINIPLYDYENLRQIWEKIAQAHRSQVVLERR